jgi:putative ABC transport system substrate-binding protein
VHIGFLSSWSADATSPFLAAFRQGLRQFGYVEGQNLATEYRWAEGQYDRLGALAAELVDRHVGVIAAASVTAALVAKQATSTIPIVFMGGGDPVDTGLVANLARPGGNVTGIGTLGVELMPKRFELLAELAPKAETIALLINPNTADVERQTREVGASAQVKGVHLVVLKAGSAAEIDAAFAALAEHHAGALVVSSAPLFNSRQEQLVTLASRYAVPAIYERREFTVAGGLMSYGPSLTAVYQQAGVYVGRILKGERAADLPVEQPSKFETVVNLKTASTLGLTVPQSILARADEVIE